MALCEDCQKYVHVINCTIDENGDHHSFDDKPALVWKEFGYISNKEMIAKTWFKHGIIHRETGPAAISTTWDETWIFEGEEVPVVEESLYKGKVIKMWENYTAIVTKEINYHLYEVLMGDKKFLVVSLDKTSEA